MKKMKTILKTAMICLLAVKQSAMAMYNVDYTERNDENRTTCVVNVSFDRSRGENNVGTFCDGLAEGVRSFCVEHRVDHIEFDIKGIYVRAESAHSTHPSTYENIIMETIKGANQVPSINAISNIEVASSRIIDQLSELDNLTELDFKGSVPPQSFAVLGKLPALKRLTSRNNGELGSSLSADSIQSAFPRGELTSGGTLENVDLAGVSGFKIILDNFPGLKFLNVEGFSESSRSCFRALLEEFRRDNPDRDLEVVGL